MGVENDIFWSEIGSGFGELGSTPTPRIPRSSPRSPCSVPNIEGFNSQNYVFLSMKAITLPYMYVNISLVSQNEIQVKMISSWFDFQLTLISSFKPGHTCIWKLTLLRQT